MAYLGGILDGSHADRILGKLEPQVLDRCGSISNSKPLVYTRFQSCSFVHRIAEVDGGIDWLALLSPACRGELASVCTAFISRHGRGTTESAKCEPRCDRRKNGNHRAVSGGDIL